jgi:hypothetical protein
VQSARVEDHGVESTDEELSNDFIKEAALPAPMSKMSKKNLDPSMDNLINAEHRGYQCRRIPILAAFEDNDAGTFVYSFTMQKLTGLSSTVLQHRECDPHAPNGCTHYGPMPYQLCCDLHNPAPFASFLEVQVVKTTRQPARSALDEVARNETDQNLQHDLEKWRCEETEKLYGRNHLRNLGPGLIMGDDVWRIVDCAHFSKISTTADLDKQTKWTHASSDFGSAIIAIIRKHYPLLPQPPPFPQPSQSQSTTFIPYMLQSSRSQAIQSNSLPLLQNMQNSLASSSKPRRRPTCSVCGVEGHTSTHQFHFGFAY